MGGGGGSIGEIKVRRRRVSLKLKFVIVRNVADMIVNFRGEEMGA